MGEAVLILFDIDKYSNLVDHIEPIKLEKLLGQRLT